MTPQNERQYGSRVRIVPPGTRTAIPTVVALPLERRRLTGVGRRKLAAPRDTAPRTARREPALAVLSALADALEAPRVGARLSRLAVQLARAVDAATLTIRLVDAGGRWLELVASTGLTSAVQREFRRLAVDTTMGRRVLRTGRRVVWAESAPASVPKLWLLGTARLRGSGAIIPLRVGRKTVGIIGVGFRGQQKPSAAVLHLLDAVGRQIGAHVCGARAREGTRRVLEETQTLRRITATLSADGAERSALDMITVAAAQLTKAFGAVVMLPSRDGTEFEVASQSDSRGSLHLVGMRFPAAGSMAEQVMRTGRSYRTRDAATDRRPLMRALVRLGGVRGLIVVPVKGVEGTIGTLNVCSVTPRLFSDRDRRVLTLLGQHASIAIQNARLFDAVRDHRQLLRRLYSEQFSLLESERKRIAHELHDEMGPTLSASLINLELFRTLDREGPTLAAKVTETEGLLKGIIEKVRELAYGLRPPMLEQLGLAESLKWMIETYFSGGALAVDYRHRGAEGALEPDLALAMYRIAQEALTNVVKHAEAKRVIVRLAVSRGRLRLKIQDDGRGFDLGQQRAAGRRAGLGLASMRERVEHLHGEMRLRSTPGCGCRLQVSCPIEVAGARPLG